MDTINGYINNIFLNAEKVICVCNIVDCGWNRNLGYMIGYTAKSTNHNGLESKEPYSFCYIHR